ncbi:uncharacterized protein RSE6_08500 [Rhynchosporium secalis]|uniref:Uncharacterized protein n=1 Tax=Rhynchosporium secalis TaxID=38038 RepID=A0A1E1MFJ5_RHYSE|nr:uncharacterized protein RSE6_08500 [Rhynchosporium secalis]
MENPYTEDYTAVVENFLNHYDLMHAAPLAWATDQLFGGIYFVILTHKTLFDGSIEEVKAAGQVFGRAIVENYPQIQDRIRGALADVIMMIDDTIAHDERLYESIRGIFEALDTEFEMQDEGLEKIIAGCEMLAKKYKLTRDMRTVRRQITFWREVLDGMQGGH